MTEETPTATASVRAVWLHRFANAELREREIVADTLETNLEKFSTSLSIA